MTADAGRAIAVRPATLADVDAVLALVHSARLSVPGVREHLSDFVVAELDGALVGAMGLEHRGADALLRSAVVREGQRGRGIGGAMFRALVRDATSRGVRTLYLLTTSADGYWSRVGFAQVPRAEVPEGVRESEEFKGACPASASAMRLGLPATDGDHPR